MLFIDNKYTRWYYQLITNAQQQNRKKLKRTQVGYIYYEKHHIIPKSLGGSNAQDNLVNLTAREHFICHWLLIKLTQGPSKNKMLYALHCMRTDRYHKRYKTKITARVYEKLRKEFSEIHSANVTGHVSSRKGKTWVEFYGKERANEMTIHLSTINKGKIAYNKGKPSSLKGVAKGSQCDEHKKKIALAKKGKPSPLKGKQNGKKGIPKPKITCPHCGETGGASPMTRWHFSNCKRLFKIGD
jgi:hypothetical protein